MNLIHLREHLFNNNIWKYLISPAPFFVSCHLLRCQPWRTWQRSWRALVLWSWTCHTIRFNTLIHCSISAPLHLPSQTPSSAKAKSVTPAGKCLVVWRIIHSVSVCFTYMETASNVCNDNRIHWILNYPFCPFCPPGTVGKSFLVRQTSQDTCGHTQGNSPTGILLVDPSEMLFAITDNVFSFVWHLLSKRDIPLLCSAFVLFLLGWINF